jgi:hypothetical protein
MTMNHCSTLLVALGASVVLGVSARATPINGAINFDGIATTDTGHLATATDYTSISDVTVVAGGTGSYAAVPTGTPATFTPFSFSASSVMPLWTFNWGGNTYSFTATSIAITHQGPDFLDIGGMGYASLNGMNTPGGTWSFTDTRVGSSTTFTFGASSAVLTTPDGGMTAVLLGLGLAGVSLGLVARRNTLASNLRR